VKPIKSVKLGGSGLKFHPEVFWAEDGTRLYYRDPIEPKKPTDDPKTDLVSDPPRRHDERQWSCASRVVDDLVPSPGRAVGRLHVARQRLRRGAARHPDEGASEVGLKEGAFPSTGSPTTPAATSLGRRREDDHVGARRTRFYRLPLDGAIGFAREQRRRPRRRRRRSRRRRTSPRPRRRRREKEKENAPGGARPECADDPDRPDDAALVASGLLGPEGRARGHDEGRRGPAERRRRRDRQSHRPPWARPEASPCPPERGLSMPPARPSSPG
jgi:hypothetical protein